MRAWIFANRALTALLAVGISAAIAAGVLLAGGDDPSRAADVTTTTTTEATSTTTVAPTTTTAPSSSVATTSTTTPSTSSVPPTDEVPTTTAPPRTPTTRPVGSFGQTAGGGREIATGVTAVWWSAPVSSGDGTRVGRIALDGPGNLVLNGEYRYSSSTSWRIIIDSASGHLADVAPGSARGEIRSDRGSITSNVDIALTDHPRVVPAWTQTAAVHIDYAGTLVGHVGVVTSRETSSIGLVGTVAVDGSYRLTAAGVLDLAGTTIPLQGSYQAIPGRLPTWVIGGVASAVSTGTAVMQDVTITLTDSRPGIAGTAKVVLDSMRPDSTLAARRVATTLLVIDRDNWVLTATGEGDAIGTSATVPGLTVATGRIEGQIRSVAGAVTWALHAPAQIVNEGLTMTGIATITGPSRFAVTVAGGRGTLFSDADTTLDRISGTVVADGAAVTGDIHVTGDASLGILLPAGWGSATDMHMRYASGAGGTTRTVDLSYALASGPSHITLDGTYEVGKPFELDVNGQATKHESAIPFDGYYRSVGFIVDGVPLRQPDYEMVGDVGAANEGAGVPIPGAATLIDGELRLSASESGRPAIALTTADAFTVHLAAVEATAFTPPTMSGTMTLQLASNSSFTITVSVKYTDENDWVETVSSTGTATFNPAGMVNLSIAASKFSGTISDTAGKISWNLAIGSVQWQNLTTGVTMTTTFTVTDDCPLAAGLCPTQDPDPVFIGFTNATVSTPSPLPTLTASGAFLTDGTWARLDASVASVTYNGISMTDLTFSMWKGSQSTDSSPNLDMPDLSSQNNGFNVELCGDFKVAIPDVTTVSTSGCVEWTPSGVVIAQSSVGASVDSQSSNGIDLGGTTIDGFAWTNLLSEPQVTIDYATATLPSVTLTLPQNVTQIAGTMQVPAALMKATGNPNADTTIPATGWYSDTDFELSGTIAVNMKSGGFTLDSISIDIGKSGKNFSLGLGANATVSIGGNHFPVSAFVGIQAPDPEIIVRLTAKGTVNADSTGGFDQPTLLPTGNFEPENSDLLDGSFDAKQTGSLVPDGGFENAASGGNLLSNSHFEAGIAPNAMTNGDFEDGTSTNLLVNGDAELTDVMYNGDFELGTLAGWTTQSGFSSKIVQDSAPANAGDSAASITNNGSYTGGISQTVAYQPIDTGSYTVSVWAKSTTTASLVVRASLQNSGAGCTSSSATPTDTSQTFPLTTAWAQYTMAVTASGCHANWQLYVAPSASVTVIVDDIELTTNTTPSTSTVTLPNQPGPVATQSFEGDAGLSVFTTNNGALTYDSTYGNQGRSLSSTGGWQAVAFNFPANSWAYTANNFDMSYDVFFPNSGTRDLSHFGFWLTGAAGSQNGFAFRVQSATGNTADSGFWTVGSGATSSRFSGGFGALPRNTWYTVRLFTTTSGTTTYLNAEVRKVSDGSMFWSTYNVSLPSGTNRSGVFGEVKGGGANEGHRYDNIRLNTGPAGTGLVTRGAAAHGGVQYVAATPGAGSWDLTTSTKETPVVGTDPGAVYSYSAWIRTSGASLNAQIGLDTVGGDYEVNLQPITITSAWQRFSVSLTVEEDGHTDLRPILRVVGDGTTQVLIDDQLLQKVNKWWFPGWCGTHEPTMWIDQDGTSSHSGSGGLTVVDLSGCGQSYFTQIPIAPQVGGTYTVTAWFRSNSPVSLQPTIQTVGGTYESSSTSITTSSTWTSESWSINVANSGHTAMRIYVNLASGYGGSPVQIDDISVVATHATVPQVSEDQWGTSTLQFDSMPTKVIVSNSNNVRIVSDYANPGNSLRTDGKGDYWFFGGGFGAASGDFDISTDLYFPNSTSREIANIGFWITNPGKSPTGYMFRAQTISTDSGFFSISNGTITRLAGNASGAVAANTWYRVRLTAVGSSVTGTVTRLSDGSVFSNTTLTMPAGNRSGVFGQVADGAGTSDGQRWDNFTVHQGDTAPVWSDAANAYDGSGYLRVDASVGTGTTSRSIATNAVAGETYTANMWVKSTSGTASGTLTLVGGAQSSSQSFTADATWRPVVVTLPITSAAGAFTVSIQDAVGGGALDVDDVDVSLIGLTQVQPWIAVSPSGALVRSAVFDDSTAAHSGDNFRAVQVSTSGDGITMPMSTGSNNSLTAGSVWTASAWVRTETGTVTGNMNLSATGGTAEGRSISAGGFTATTDWQQIFVSLPVAYNGHTGASISITLTTTGQRLIIDDVSLLPVPNWTLDQPTGVTVHEMIVDELAAPGTTPTDPPVSGPGYLQIVSTGANGGVGASVATTITPGSTYVMEGYVRSRTGSSLTGQFTLTASGSGAADTASTTFTATDSWSYVVVNLPTTVTNSQLRADVLTSVAGTFDIDQLSIRPNIITQADPWIADSGVTAVVKDRPDLAHDSNGLMMMRATAQNTGIRHDVTANPTKGTTYNVTAWVRSPAGTAINGSVQLSATGGSAAPQVQSQTFTTAGSDWQYLTFSMMVADDGRTMLGVKVLVTTTGQELYVDDVIVQQAGPWTAGGSATTNQIGDASQAQSGSGYLTISKNSASNAWVQRTTSGTVGVSTTQTMSVWVRSAGAANVNGRVTITAQGGTSAASSATTSFVAGSTWQLVTANVTVTGSDQSALVAQVFNDTQGTPLAIDTVIVGQAPINQNPDGVNSPLDHPESGYTYLWDDAFGIPGAHLWALTAQIQVSPTGAGLGVGGTLYFDPSQMSGIIKGSTWLQSNMTLNISRTDPCLSFGFDATKTPDVYVQIQGGVFKTQKFQISFAPRGCQIGEYSVPQGASFGFQTELGDATFFIDIAITRGDDGPEFHSDMGLSNLIWGGFTFNQMELKIDVTPTSSSTSFIGDFELPMGKFYGSFDLTASEDGIESDGQVTVTDWQMANGVFDVSEFSYTQHMDIPTGGCGVMDQQATNGSMTLGAQTYQFDGELSVNCGEIKVLMFHFQYWHGHAYLDYYIDYESSTRTLAGGVQFDFDRKISWKYFGVHHTRHPKFAISLDFTMPIDDPSEGSLTLTGDVSVAGGSGSVNCAFGGTGQDDQCNLSVTVTVFGTINYSSTW